MPPKTQRTINEAWSQPAKRRRLNHSVDESTPQNSQYEKSSKDSVTKPIKREISKREITKKEISKRKNTKNDTPKRDASESDTPKPTIPEQQAPSSPPSTKPSPSRKKTKTLTTHPLRTSLFSSPPRTLLCHATNSLGHWGAGIALSFKIHYPSAFNIYKNHCLAHKSHPSDLLGMTLLIPPQTKSASKAEREAGHWIGCFFTSVGVGKARGSVEGILRATGEAVRELVGRVREVREGGGVEGSGDGGVEGDGEEVVGIREVRMCKINSGLFGVPWEATRAVIEGVEVGKGDLEEVVVCSVD